MTQRGLRVLEENKTFFGKITNTITKLLIPTKVGINGLLILAKRNNVLKAFENYTDEENEDETNKKEILLKKYEDMYGLYLESIDKYVMDSIYKKVKNDTATVFEKNALSQYYNVIHLKESQYLEYKYRKQKYLLELDYESILTQNKEKIINRYKKFYATKMEELYKGILKNYSIQLADNSGGIERKNQIYENIFATLEEYISNILPIKMEIDHENTYKEIIEEYDKFNTFLAGKLDEIDIIEKKVILLGISRKLFTHSLPLIVAEQCYIKLLKDTRSLIVDTKVARKKEKAYASACAFFRFLSSAPGGQCRAGVFFTGVDLPDVLSGRRGSWRAIPFSARKSFPFAPGIRAPSSGRCGADRRNRGPLKIGRLPQPEDRRGPAPGAALPRAE